jgi:hypothetical protein
MSNTLQILLFKFHGKFNLSVKDLAETLGLHENHIRNEISEGNFGLHTFKQGGKRVARIDDLADYIDKISLRDSAKRRGPRTAAEKIAAAKAEMANHV